MKMDKNPPDELQINQMNVVGGVRVFQRDSIMPRQGGQVDAHAGTTSMPISVGGWMDMTTAIPVVDHPTADVSPMGGGRKPPRAVPVSGDQDEWVRSYLCLTLFSRRLRHFTLYITGM